MRLNHIISLKIQKYIHFQNLHKFDILFSQIDLQIVKHGSECIILKINSHFSLFYYFNSFYLVMVLK